MKYLAAYLLLVEGGVSTPSKEQIVSLLSSVGVEIDESRIDSLLSELSGKSVDELISEGNLKLASVPTGGASSGAAAASSGSAAAVEEEEAKEESAAEDSDADMGFGLFD